MRIWRASLLKGPDSSVVGSIVLRVGIRGSTVSPNLHSLICTAFPYTHTRISPRWLSVHVGDRHRLLLVFADEDGLVAPRDVVPVVMHSPRTVPQDPSNERRDRGQTNEGP